MADTTLVHHSHLLICIFQMSEKVTVAIFGLGRIGQIHLWNLLSNNQIRLKWIVEANTEHATSLLEERRVSRDIKVCGLSDLQTVLDDNRYAPSRTVV